MGRCFEASGKRQRRSPFLHHSGGSPEGICCAFKCTQSCPLGGGVIKGTKIPTSGTNSYLPTAYKPFTPQAEFRNGTGRWALLENCGCPRCHAFRRKNQHFLRDRLPSSLTSAAENVPNLDKGLGVCLQLCRGGITIQIPRGPCWGKDQHRRQLSPGRRRKFKLAAGLAGTRKP